MEYIIIALVIFASALLQGLSGFGSALIAMSILPMIVDLQFAVPLVALNAIALNTLNFYKVKKQFKFKELIPVIIGAAVGVPIGIHILENVDPAIIKPVIGTFLTAYSIYSIFNKPHHIKKATNILGVIFGFLSGVMGGAFNMNGPFIVIYYSMRYTDKHAIKAAMSSYFIIAGAYICTLLTIKGFINTDVLKSFIIYLPVLIGGILIGQHFYNKINHEAFKKVIYLILSVSGLLLIFN